MISDVYFPRVNGVSTSIQSYRAAISALGHKVTLIAPSYPQSAELNDGVIRISSRYLFVDPEDRMMRYKDILGLADSLRNAAVDLIHIQTPFIAHYAGLELARLLDVPSVETYHTFFEEYLYHYIKFLPKPWVRAAARRFSTRQCNKVNALIVPSSAMRDVLGNYGVTTQTEIIPTGLALNQFHRGSRNRFRKHHGIPENRPVLLYVGRVVFEKNIDFLLRVTQRIKHHKPDILFIIAGAGPALKHLQKLAATLGLKNNTLFVGYLDREQGLPDCYSAADLFVFASRTETQGLVLLEAMALGIPVVSTAVMGTKDILRNNPGALVAEENAVDFSAKILGLLNDKAAITGLGAKAIATAHLWEQHIFATKMLAFYEKIISSSLHRVNPPTAPKAVSP